MSKRIMCFFFGGKIKSCTIVLTQIRVVLPRRVLDDKIGFV